jgi:hypothetical protein
MSINDKYPLKVQNMRYYDHFDFIKSFAELLHLPEHSFLSEEKSLYKAFAKFYDIDLLAIFNDIGLQHQFKFNLSEDKMPFFDTFFFYSDKLKKLNIQRSDFAGSKVFLVETKELRYNIHKVESDLEALYLDFMEKCFVKFFAGWERTISGFDLKHDHGYDDSLPKYFEKIVEM